MGEQGRTISIQWAGMWDLLIIVGLCATALAAFVRFVLTRQGDEDAPCPVWIEMPARYFGLMVVVLLLRLGVAVLTFSELLFVLTVITGIVAGIDRFFLRAKRPAETQPSAWIEYPVSFFPVILVVFMLRSFLVEPFKIPSGSMLPTLLIGDFILVNKFTYGVRIPIVNTRLIEVNQPQRGEVMVFRYPEDPSLDYIKRIVGVPGDKIEYRNKQLIINGQPVAQQDHGTDGYQDPGPGLRYVHVRQLRENLNGHEHTIYVQPEVPPSHISSGKQFPHRENCVYNDSGFTCDVPPGHYFMMGDNRDNSSDSRVWGFVPDRNIVGKAFLIWWNFENLGRIGQSIH